ncbi:unnamed protein product [Mytilus coruscus]|uniref:C1q domain-containing protein n=1 Tax=Mytilus coruscus TaxID=42192 RepID=A0A6J8BW88_MYTCO|nr:unnamed protein product [Mytilus coruscus]
MMRSHDTDDGPLKLRTVKSTFKSEDLKSRLSDPDSTIPLEQVRQLDEILTTKFHSKFKEMKDEHHLHSKKIKEVEETLLQQKKEIYRLKHVEITLLKEQKKTAKLIETVERLTFMCNIYQRDRSTNHNHSNIFRTKMLQQFESDAIFGHSNLRNQSKEGQKLSNVEAEENIMIVNNHKREENGDTEKLILGAAASSTESTVAFYAFLTHNEKNIGPHHSLIFDHVETNMGSNYNRYTGAFIVPTTGVYLLTYTVFMETQSYGSFEIAVNNVARGTVFVDNNTDAQNAYTGSTCVAILVLNQGDVCIVRTHSNYPNVRGSVRSDYLMRTSFSGAKIGST